MRTSRTWAACFLGLGLLLGAGCGDDEGPAEVVTVNEDDVPGNYSATFWAVLATPVDTASILGEGGSLDMTLTSTGEVVGQVLIPPGELSSTLRNVSLDGAWAWNASTHQITLFVEPDSFLDGIELDVRVVGTRIRLLAEELLPDGQRRLQLVLTRAG